MPGSNYRIIARKIDKRKRVGRESSVYRKGKLVPAAKFRKESSRHGYMTTLERYYMTQGTYLLLNKAVPLFYLQFS